MFIFYPIKRTKDLLRLYLFIISEFSFIGPSKQPSSLKNKILICWSFSPAHFVTLNTDGASLGNLGKAGIGGLLRYHLG